MNAAQPNLVPAPPPTPAGAPRANVLSEGFRTAMPHVPEDAAAIKERERMYFNTLCPRNYFQAWLADDVALMTLRLERVARIERRERDRIALRAEFFWDDDRRGEAEQLGRRLAGPRSPGLPGPPGRGVPGPGSPGLLDRRLAGLAGLGLAGPGCRC